ncbi:hypothetical protein G7K_1422-t1 [Saitoella complicata NRRL Y-17804]|uniref:Eukaryotic translation initiation factor 3 subunit M n=1 Tax=Saitoella complicata (strain BCRC 22490 / CBS 7301 / JCM 7358 / NBRC 10748 / NRRL Y-17804) TaxID=698492 RepID=A0A0E9NBF8_SAICN|nr:hypothetical protein G7K_1422-t1 [Saitoella complicata NRRL Y-17804]
MINLAIVGDPEPGTAPAAPGKVCYDTKRRKEAQLEMNMASNILIVDGKFEDQVYELAVYIDRLNGATDEAAGPLVSSIADLSEEEVLQRLVEASSVLSNASEKEYEPAANLLINLIRSAPTPALIDTLLKNLSNPPSTPNGPALSLTVLSTVFNVLPSDSAFRAQTFLTLLSVARSHDLYDALQPQLTHLRTWLSEWSVPAEVASKVLNAVIDAAENAEDDKTAYATYLLALQQEGANAELAVRAVQHAVERPPHFNFDDLIALEPVRGLKTSKPEMYAILEVFLSGDYAGYKALPSHTFNDDLCTRKIRLLTLASLAASSISDGTRHISYETITSSLDIPAADVELWIIDCIQCHLIEGKLSQLTSSFTVHRATYRVFEREQWELLSKRLNVWRGSLEGVLSVVRGAKEGVQGVEGRLKEAQAQVNEA